MLRLFRLAGFGLVAGCSIFTAFDGVSGGADDGGTSVGADGASTEDGGGAAADTGASATDSGGATDSNVGIDADADAALPNLQPNGGFEIVNAAGCGSEWGVFQGTATRVSTPRSDTYSCKACGNHPTDKTYSLNDGDSTNITVAPGQRYFVEAWVRAIDAAGEGQTVRGIIRIYAPGSSTDVVQRIDPPTIALTTTWARLETLLDITQAGDFNYYISFNNGALGSCALVDDVVIHRMW
jgi:hypothetical protein